MININFNANYKNSLTKYIIMITEEEKNINLEKLKNICFLTELINQSQPNLSISLMKICQHNNYKPLSIDNYYQNVFNQMDNLKRTNGLKYKSKSIRAVRSAIISNNLFCRNRKNKNWGLRNS